MKIAVTGATGRVGRHIVDVLEERGHEPVPISRSNGFDVITAAGLAEALAGTDVVIDAATGASPEQQAATEFFTTAARNIQTHAAAAGVRRVVTVSIIGCERFVAGYSAAKCAHEQAALAGPVPAVILRAAQFPSSSKNSSTGAVRARSRPRALRLRGLLPSPHATLAGPTFAEWLETRTPAARTF